jgi:ABC-type cobalamin/Fe3+-siderophores transport system ATPase subunit
MTNQFNFSIPRTNEPELTFSLRPGDVLYMLGANGTGKSSLISRLFSAYQATAKRISAHRQTWFQSNTLDMTPRNRENLEQNIRTQDAQEHARYYLEYAAERASVAIYDLVDSDTMLARKIADLVRAGDIPGAEKGAKTPAPIQVINELMRLSNIPIEISLEERQKVVARKNGGSGYSVAELSDGERNAFLIAADVLTAKPGTLVLIDEPERHLHRSIISPLLKQLFDKRKDCVFIVSTHELMLPLDTPKAATLLLRDCEYAGKKVKAWTVDLLEPGAPIDEALKSDLLGSRRKIIFVEGTAKSLDAPLYSLLFPQVSVVPKDGCRDVEHAVRGLRSAEGMHWIAAWGIVDNDQRSPEDIARLRAAGIWALSHYSVESLYYHPSIIARVAERQAALIGADAATLVKTALTDAVAAVRSQKDHLVTSAVLRSVRDKMLTRLPTRNDVEVGAIMKLEVDIAALRTVEKAQFDALIAAADWDCLLVRYPLRESSAFDRVVSALKLVGRETYREAVLKLLQDEQAAVSELRDLLGDLYANVMN